MPEQRLDAVRRQAGVEGDGALDRLTEAAQEGGLEEGRRCRQQHPADGKLAVSQGDRAVAELPRLVNGQQLGLVLGKRAGKRDQCCRVGDRPRPLARRHGVLFQGADGLECSSGEA
eukprot:scaffold63174_cov76-Phaeocystis_antarctica.AAC.3